VKNNTVHTVNTNIHSKINVKINLLFIINLLINLLFYRYRLQIKWVHRKNVNFCGRNFLANNWYFSWNWKYMLMFTYAKHSAEEDIYFAELKRFVVMFKTSVYWTPSWTRQIQANECTWHHKSVKQMALYLLSENNAIVCIWMYSF
jgi:hypothetical protein